jgi:hypothetical protein
MLRKIIISLLVILSLPALGQEKTKVNLSPASDSVSIRKSRSAKVVASTKTSDTIATIDMYKITSLNNDTTFVDTSLTIQNHYKVNYLRKDNFGLLPFSNVGHTYNTLDFGHKNFNPFPEFGFKAKHFAYMEVDDINYYNVATPYTDLFYRSVMQQGQLLDAFVTLNTSENLNFAAGYKGLRSLGRYINNLSSNGNFRFITSYNTKDKRYFLKLHFTGQDFTNQENGGIVNISDFESGEEPFTQRERLDVFLRDATSVLKGNRYFIDHSFRLNKSNPNSIVFRHRFNYENKFFEFNQLTASPLFGEAYRPSIYNKTRYNRMYNLVGAAYKHELLGLFEFYAEDYNYNYYYNRIVLNADGSVRVPNRLNDRINTYGARYTYNKNNLAGTVLFSNSITDQSLANIELTVSYSFDEVNKVSLKYQNMNKLPDLNYRLYQSDYVNYNWSESFKNEKINNFEAEARTKWLTLSAQYTILKDHLFFADTYTDFGATELDTLLVKPNQYNSTINYFSVKAGKEFRVWKLSLDNTILYQSVSQQDNVLNVPDFVTRNTLYYSDYLFKNALFIQTGITFQYFTKYYADNYNPVIGEFYVQDRRKIGGYPLFDFFLNAKIQEFRLFLKAEHFNSGFTGYNFYSAPNYPYRDFTIRFGIIWNFFS